MAHLIEKAALVTEIESLWKHYLDAQEFDFGWNQALDKVLSYLDTLEVKEIDLEKELSAWWNNHYADVNKDYTFEKYSGHYIENPTLISLITHFFELGLNTQQNINIYITNIDKVIEDNGVDPNSKEAKVFKESYYMALEKLKAKKGE